MFRREIVLRLLLSSITLLQRSTSSQIDHVEFLYEASSSNLFVLLLYFLALLEIESR